MSRMSPFCWGVVCLIFGILWLFLYPVLGIIIIMVGIGGFYISYLIHRDRWRSNKAKRKQEGIKIVSELELQEEPTPKLDLYNEKKIEIKKKYCIGCGEEIQSHQKFCSNCEGIEVEEGKYCPKCGEIIQSYQKFCVNCAHREYYVKTKLEVAQDKKIYQTCPQCGYKIYEMKESCPKCGKRLFQ